MEGTRKTMSKMIKTPHLAKTPRHSYKTHGPWLSNVAAYKASAWNAGVFSKFEIPTRQELSANQRQQKCQTPANHQKSYNQILQKPPDHIPDRKTHGKCKATEVFKWKFLKLWTFSDTGAAGYIYCQFTNLPSGQFATETTCHAPTCLPGIYWNHLSCTNLPARYMSVTTTFGSNALCQVGG